MCLNRDAIATAAPRRSRVRQLVPTTDRVAPRNSLKRPPPRPRLLSRTDTPRPDSMPIARAGPLSCGPPGPGLSGPGSSRDPSTPDTGPRRTGPPTPCYEVASSSWPSRAPAPYARPFWETPLSCSSAVVPSRLRRFVSVTRSVLDRPRIARSIASSCRGADPLPCLIGFLGALDAVGGWHSSLTSSPPSPICAVMWFDTLPADGAGLGSREAVTQGERCQ
jgi:hypothetical protein